MLVFQCWFLPADAKNDTRDCFSVNDDTASGSEVIKEDLDANDPGQQWNRSTVDISGYFTLQSINSGKFLTADLKTNKLTIEGMYLSTIS